jgi:hypothetical protein
MQSENKKSSSQNKSGAKTNLKLVSPYKKGEGPAIKIQKY